MYFAPDWAVKLVYVVSFAANPRLTALRGTLCREHPPEPSCTNRLCNNNIYSPGFSWKERFLSAVRLQSASLNSISSSLAHVKWVSGSSASRVSLIGFCPPLHTARLCCPFRTPLHPSRGDRKAPSFPKWPIELLLLLRVKLQVDSSGFLCVARFLHCLQGAQDTQTRQEGKIHPERLASIVAALTTTRKSQMSNSEPNISRHQSVHTNSIRLYLHKQEGTGKCPSSNYDSPTRNSYSELLENSDLWFRDVASTWRHS